jgi:putative nucleotidyltransferase with HDIG domain
MARRSGVQSLFSQRLDRALFAIYFLGAVVPVLALAFVVQRHVLPGLPDDPRAVAGWVGAVGGLGLLVLSLYFALRRISHATLARLDADNLRLEKLLGASRRVAAASDFDTITNEARRCAQEISGAEEAFVLVEPRGGKELELGASAGPRARALMDAHGEALEELVSGVIRDGGVEAWTGPGIHALALAVEQPHEVRGAIVLVDGRRDAPFEPETVDALRTLGGLAGIALEKGGLELAQRNFFTHVTDLLVSALDAHVDDREGHATNVARLANRLAHHLGLDAARLGRLHFAALLHDVGMLKIERSRHRSAAACRRHTVMGARMLARIRFWEDAAPVVLHHHEWFDGSGYPEGLAGEDIPLEARIVAVADAVDAMGRAGRAREGILRELEEGSGTQFDPAVVAAFRALAEVGELPIA